MTPIARSELILGGQKSGKSRRAEMLAREWLAQSPAHRAVLIATAQAWDEARPGPGNWRNDREPLDERIIERYKPRGSASAAPDRTGD